MFCYQKLLKGEVREVLEHDEIVILANARNTPIPRPKSAMSFPSIVTNFPTVSPILLWESWLTNACIYYIFHYTEEYSFCIKNLTTDALPLLREKSLNSRAIGHDLISASPSCAYTKKLVIWGRIVELRFKVWITLWCKMEAETNPKSSLKLATPILQYSLITRLPRFCLSPLLRATIE